MGLDMYLRAERYLAAYSFSKPEMAAMCDVIAKIVGIAPAKESPTLTVVVTIGSWRKANAIHAYFVRCLQSRYSEGTDDCRPIPLHREELTTLAGTCKALLVSRNVEEAKRLLPPQAGFFFGSTEIDDSYWADLANTVEIVERALKLPADTDFSYRASW